MGNTVELTGNDVPRPMEGDDPFVGRSLRHYEVIERIGQGGMSVVYRGRDHRLHRDVAIKLLHPFLAEKAECRLRLAREARAVARLEHENILRIFDFSGDPPTLNERPGADRRHEDRDGFLVTELVVGDTLKHFAAAHDLWDVPEVGALVVLKLTRALEHAHEHGVIHRDLKPENVMVRDDGVLKLMDFGIAQVADAKSLTVTGTLLGSPAHMAPECIEGLPADERSDIFSLGTVLYWLATGALPFEAMTPHALLKAIVDGRFPPPQQRNPRVSDDLARVVTRAMATDPQQRFPDTAAMCEALEHLLAEAGLVGGPMLLERILSDPEGELPRVAETVRVTALARSKRLLDDDEPARALSVLSRVVAAHPGDPEAMALLERAQLGADDDERDETPPDVTGDVDVPGPASRASAWVARASVAAGVVGLLAMVATVARVVEQQQATAATVPTARPAEEPAEAAMSMGDPSSSARKAGEPPPAKPILVPLRSVAIGGPRVKLDVGKRDDVAARDKDADPTRAADAAVVATTLRPVEVRVRPHAKLIVDDGAPIDVFREKTVELAPGVHVLRFSNPAAIGVEKRVEVPADGPVPPIVVELEPAPAQLLVDTGGVEATVAIRPIGGRGDDKILPPPHDGSRPIPVFFDKDASGKTLSVQIYEVTATAPGRRPRTERAKLVAGKTSRLRLVLEPAADAAVGPIPGAPPGP